MKYVYDATGLKHRVINQTAIPGVNIPMGNITALESSQIADTQTEDYIGNIIYKNGALYAIKTPEGYAKSVNGSTSNWEYTYQIKDYLGSVRCEVSQNGTLLGKTDYYPFGMEFGDSPLPLQEKERFNGMELEPNHGLNLLDYGARRHDPALGRFTTMDPLAEKYYAISPYVYCLNNPVKYVDPDGRDISFTYGYKKDENGNYLKNKSGGYNLIGVTMNVTGKVINISSNSKVDMTEATSRISSQIESSFSGDVNGVKFSTNVNLFVANSMDDVAESDYVFALANFEKHQDEMLQGHANLAGGKVAFIDADYFTGPLDTGIGNVGPGTAAHEFGHLAGLEHSTGLMMKEPGGILWMTSKNINSNQLNTILNNKTGLNKGINWEIIPTYNPSSGRTRMKKMPYRGAAKPYVSHGY
jgi:RHS repeat-associated protein